MQTLLTEKQLAERLNISVRTLQCRRVSGGGIPFIKVGRSVRYSLDDVDKYIADRQCKSTSEHTSNVDL